MDNISKIDLAVGLDLEQLKRDKDKAEALVRHLTEVNRKIETTFEIKLLNEKEIKSYAKTLMSSIQSDFNKALKEQEKESRDSINRRYKTEEQLFIKHSSYLSKLQDKINKETNESVKKALQERYNLANNANFGSEAELSKFKGKTEKLIAWTRKEANEEVSIKRAKNNTIRQLEEKLAGETRAIYRKSYQDRIQYINNTTIKNKEQLDKTLSHIRVMAKEADNEFNKMSRSYRGVLSNETGTTFGHKFLTTSQYAMSGLALVRLQQAFGAVAKEALAFDDAIYNNMTVLQATRKESEELARSSRELAMLYGGSIKDIDELTLTLGRAGVEVKNLRDATEASVALATITGDSFKDASEVTSSFITTFIANMKEAGLSVGNLADKLAYAANASRLSVKDLGTVGNYALITANNLNITSDATGALIATLSNLGMNASTIGTSFRRLEKVFNDVKLERVFNAINIAQDGSSRTQAEWKKAIRENSNELVNFAKELRKIKTEDFERLVPMGGDILLKNTLSALRNGSEIFENHFNAIRQSMDLTVIAQAKAMGATTQLQRLGNAVTSSMNGVVTSLLDLGERKEISDLTERYGELIQNIGKANQTEDEIKKTSTELMQVQDELSTKVSSFNDKIKALNSTVSKTIVFLIGSGGAYIALKSISAVAVSVIANYKSLIAATTALGTSTSITTKMMIGLRSALISTGFGAIAIGVGALAASFFDLGDSAKKASNDLDKLNENLESMSKNKLKLELFNVNDEIKELEKSKKEIEKTLAYINDRKSKGAVYNEKGAKKIVELESELEDIRKRINDLTLVENDLQDALVDIYHNRGKASKDETNELNKQKDLTEHLLWLDESRKKTELEILKAKISIAKQGKDDDTYKLRLKSAEKVLELEEDRLKAITGITTDKEILDQQIKVAQARLELLKIENTETNKKNANDLAFRREIAKLNKDIARAETESTKDHYLTQLIYLDEQRRLAYEDFEILKERYGWEEEEINKLRDARDELFNQELENLNVKFEIEVDDKLSDMFNDLIDKQNELTESTMNWLSSLKTSNETMARFANGLSSVSSAMFNIGKNSSDNIRDTIELSEKYSEEWDKLEGKEEEQNKLQKQYIKDIDLLNKKATRDQIKGYSEIAGAMSTMFKEGSREAAAFRVVEQGLALVAAVRGIATQASGDPYTAAARMAAMAATMVSLLSNIGVALGFNKNKEYYDDFSKQEVNIGAGSLLGDGKTASDSINNSLESLADYAQPQFRVLVDMNKAVQNINNQIVGVTRLLISNSDFAMGKGFVGLDTGWGDSSATKAFKGLDNAMGNMLGKDLKKVFDMTGFGLINKALGKVAGAIFGKKPTTITLHDSGLTFDAMNLEDALDGIIGRQYQVNKRVEKKKSVFGSSTKTYYDSYFKDLDKETNKQFTMVLNSLYDTVLSSGEALDVASNETAKNLSGFVVNLGKLSLKDKTGEQIQELLGNTFSKLGDDLVKTAFPLLDAFQQIGEGMFETLQRVAIGMEESKYYISRLGKDFENIAYTDIYNKQGNVGYEALYQSIVKFEQATYPLNENLLMIIDSVKENAEELFELYVNLDGLRDRLRFLGHDINGLSNDMITGAGSVEALQDGFNSFYKGFLSDNEQLAFETGQLIKSFDKLGLAIPATKEDFKALLGSLDLTSSSGQDLYGRLIVLSEAFADVYDEVENLANGIYKTIDKLRKIAEDFINSFSKVKDNGNQTSILRYNEMREEFRRMFDEKGILRADVELEEVEKLYTSISNLGKDLGQNNNHIVDSLVNQFKDDLDRFDYAKDVMKVNIVDGLKGLEGLTQLQVQQLQSIANPNSNPSSPILTPSNNYTYNSTQVVSSSGTISDALTGLVSNLVSKIADYPKRTYDILDDVVNGNLKIKVEVI